MNLLPILSIKVVMVLDGWVKGCFEMSGELICKAKHTGTQHEVVGVGK